jgi:hypothetical protein
LAKKKKYQNSRGASLITTLVFGALLAVSAWVGIEVGQIYYRFFEIQAQFDQIINVASAETDAELRKRLMYHIKKQDIPVDPEDLKIERAEKRIRISLKWEEDFYVTWKEKDHTFHTFSFHAYSEGDV